MYSSDGCEILNVFRGFPTLTGFGHVIGRALHLYLDLMSSTGKCGKRFITNSHQDLIAAMHQHWASVVHPLLQLRNNRRTIPTPHNNAFIGGLVHLWWDSVHSITPYAQIAGGTPTSWRCVVMTSIQSCPYLYFYYDLCRKPWTMKQTDQLLWKRRRSLTGTLHQVEKGSQCLDHIAIFSGLLPSPVQTVTACHIWISKWPETSEILRDHWHHGCQIWWQNEDYAILWCLDATQFLNEGPQHLLPFPRISNDILARFGKENWWKWRAFHSNSPFSSNSQDRWR